LKGFGLNLAKALLEQGDVDFRIQNVAEFINSVNLPRVYAISKVLCEGFEGFRTNSIFMQCL
jgi:hypothetical protein